MDNLNLFDLTNKTAIVTGGGNGIGKATCITLVAYGANVVVSDYNLESAKEVVKEIINKGGKAIAIECDVTNDEALINLVNKTIETYGQINILVNNVGGGGGGRENPEKIDVSEFKRVYEMNVFIMWRLSQLVAPKMKESGYGSIINISSMASINKSANMSAYSSSKTAVNHMTANLAYDFGPYDIRVNAVAPGATRTAALDKVLTPEIESKMLEHTPIKRICEPEDIAGAVLYFAAPVSSWVS